MPALIVVDGFLFGRMEQEPKQCDMFLKIAP